MQRASFYLMVGPEVLQNKKKRFVQAEGTLGNSLFLEEASSFFHEESSSFFHEEVSSLLPQCAELPPSPVAVVVVATESGSH